MRSDQDELQTIGACDLLSDWDAAVRTRGADAALADDRTCLTYEALDRLTDAVASALVSRAVGPETLVGLIFDRPLDYVVAALAVLKAGGAFVIPEPAVSGVGGAAPWSDAARPRLWLHRGVQVGDGCIPPGAGALDLATLEPGPRHRWRDFVVAPRQLAYLLYSSGSTGRSKAIMIERGNLGAFVRALRSRLELSARDRWLQLASPAFDVFIEEVFPILTAGGCVLCRGDLTMPDFSALQRLLAGKQATLVEMSTQYWYEYQKWLEAMQLAPPPGLRRLIVGGEHMDSTRYRRWQARFATPLVHVYGLTETTVSSTIFDGPVDESDAEVSLGTALDHNRIRLQDSAARSEQEIVIAGEAVGRGYLGDPALTAARFRPDPFGPAGSRVFMTGDDGALAEGGALVFCGRNDRQVKLRGRRLELDEIEAVLRSVSFVEQATALIAPAPRSTLVAFVVRRGARADAGPAIIEPLSEPEHAALSAALLRELPEWARPAQVLAVSEMPRNQRGKIDREALRQRYGQMQRFRPAADTAGDAVLEAVLQAFRNALERPDLSGDADFFDCGGDSLSALALVSSLATLDVEDLSVATIFDAPTPGELAAWLRRRLPLEMTATFT